MIDGRTVVFTVVRSECAAASIASFAITRYVVSLPPAIITRPGTGVTTVCSREILDEGSRRAAQQRPQPGVHALDVVVVERLA